MKRNNYFYKDNQGKNIILSISSTYIELQAPDGYFYFLGKFNNKIQELARKVIPNEIGKLIQEQKEIATGTLERIGKENFPFEKVILKADNKKEMLKIIKTLKKAKWFGKLEIIMADIDKNMTYLRKKEKDNSRSQKMILFDDDGKEFDVIVDSEESENAVLYKKDIYVEEKEIFEGIKKILA
jgi:hypothetical protein